MPTVVPVFGQSDLPIVSGNTSQDYFFWIGLLLTCVKELMVGKIQVRTYR